MIRRSVASMAALVVLCAPSALQPARAQNAVALRAATLLGGADPDNIADIAVAPDGTVYVAGTTESSDFPATPGAFDTTLDGADAFVARFSADLSTLLAATLIGGLAAEEGHALAVAPDGLYLVGSTDFHSGFPVTPGAFDITFGGLTDAFVARLSPDLSTVHAATFLGGVLEDRAFTVALDGADVVVAGFTASFDFPFSAGAYSADPGPEGGPFVARLNADLSALHAATALGDAATVNALAVDAPTGEVVIGGHVTGEDYPTTPGAYDRTCGADGLCDFNAALGIRWGDGFVSRLDRSLSALLTSTFLGGSVGDAVAGLVLYGGEVVVAGGTSSKNFPTTPGAFLATMFYPSIGGFVSRFSGDLTTLRRSTYLHGGQITSSTTLYDLHVDPATERIYAVGNTNDSFLPVTPDAFGGSEGVYASVLVAFSRDLSRLPFSSRLGGFNSGVGNPGAVALVAAPAGELYFAGIAAEENFPVTTGAFQRSFGGGIRDGYVARVTTEAAVRLRAVPTAYVLIPAAGGRFDFTVTLQNTTDQPQTAEVWTSVTGPASRSRILGPQAITIPPGGTVTRTVTQQVPAAAPPGFYTYLAQVGAFPVGGLATSFFPIRKTELARPAEANAGAVETDWPVSGWDAEAAAASALPATTSLHAAYPNPARGGTTVAYDLAAAADVRLAVYDVLGRAVALLVDTRQGAGRHAVPLNASRLPAGTYLVRLDAGDARQTRRLTIVH